MGQACSFSLNSKMIVNETEKTKISFLSAICCKCIIGSSCRLFGTLSKTSVRHLMNYVILDNHLIILSCLPFSSSFFPRQPSAKFTLEQTDPFSCELLLSSR